MIDVGIVGGTGYTGVELLRLLSGHEQVNIKTITSRAERIVRDQLSEIHRIRQELVDGLITVY